MLELTADNVLEYLRSTGRLPTGPACAEALGWGVSNIVLRIETVDGPFILKQSRPRLRTRDAWFSDIERVYREQEVMEALYPLLPEPVVPRVLFNDRANYVFAMTAAPRDSRVWKEVLLSGEVDLGIGERAGAILGQIHEGSSRDERFHQFKDRKVFEQLRIDPFYIRIQERRPEVASEVGRLIERMRGTDLAICHGDYSPKNILTHAQGFTLVDYEAAHFGDPTMDLGFFLSHLLLKTIRLPSLRESFFSLTRAFWEGYARAIGFLPLTDLQPAAIAHCGVCLLARVDGTSPVDYLPEETRRNAVRSLGRRLLKDPPHEWDEVLSACGDELNRMELAQP